MDTGVMLNVFLSVSTKIGVSPEWIIAFDVAT